MVLFPINIRELRSFRLRQSTENFVAHLTTEDSSTLYAMCDTLHPQERVEMRGRFVHEQGLCVTFLPKNVSQILLQKTMWKELRNLLQGHVVEIRSQSGKALTEEQLRFILNHGKFSPRLLLWRRQFYRAQSLRDFLAESNLVRNMGSKVPAAQVSNAVSFVTKLPFLVERGNRFK